MRKIFIILLLGNLFASQSSIAVIDFESINLRQTDANALTQRLTTELINLDKYTVLERSLIQQIIEEQKFQYSGNVNIETISDLGSMIGADYVIIGTISKVGGVIFSVDARIIDVTSSKSLKSANFDGDDIGALLKYGMKEIAYQLCGMDSIEEESMIVEPKRDNVSPPMDQSIYPTKHDTPKLNKPFIAIKDDDESEPWYYYFSYSIMAPHVYAEEMEQFIKDTNELRTERIEGSIELIGIYWHLKPEVIGGLVYDFSIDTHQYTFDATLEMIHSFLGFSIIGYFSKFGEGAFYKLDLGTANMDYVYEDYSYYDSSTTEFSESGMGFGLGVGYSYYLDVFNKTRAFISYNLSIRNIDMTNSTVPILEDFESYSKSTINFGFIF